MPSVYDTDAFSTRVSYAKRCILTGHTGGRSFDTCFEMYDGDFVMIRLWQEAENNPSLADRLKGYGTTNCRELYEKIRHMTPRQIAALAREHRDGKLQEFRAKYPQYAHIF